MLAEGAATVPLVGDTLCLLGHEVGDHVRRRSESGGNIAELDMLAAEMDAHVDVSRSGLVGGMQCHGDGDRFIRISVDMTYDATIDTGGERNSQQLGVLSTESHSQLRAASAWKAPSAVHLFGTIVHAVLSRECGPQVRVLDNNRETVTRVFPMLTGTPNKARGVSPGTASVRVRADPVEPAFITKNKESHSRSPEGLWIAVLWRIS